MNIPMLIISIAILIVAAAVAYTFWREGWPHGILTCESVENNCFHGQAPDEDAEQWKNS